MKHIFPCLAFLYFAFVASEEGRTHDPGNLVFGVAKEQQNQTSIEEKGALIALFHATNGTEWRENSNWLVGDPCVDTWHGVSCRNGVVTGLRLFANRLHGTVPSSFSALIHLESLDLSYNNLNGSLPIVAHSPKLQIINVEYNDLELHLAALAPLHHLHTFRASYNQYVAGRFGDAIALEHVDLSHTPAKFDVAGVRLLRRLRVLKLASMGLCGPFPDLGVLLHLRTLDVSGNDFAGPLPASLGELMTLVDVNVADNFFSGPVPSFKSNELKTLRLADNDFIAGPGVYLGGDRLTIFDASRNHRLGRFLFISRSVDVADVRALTDVRCCHCGLSGRLDGAALGTASSLVTLKLAGNGLFGSIPVAITVLPMLKLLDLSHNNLSGGIPPSLSLMPKLRHLHLQSNKISGSFPLTTSLVDLEEIRLDDNSLSGEMLAETSLPARLRLLSVFDNRLTAASPQALAAAQQHFSLLSRQVSAAEAWANASVHAYLMPKESPEVSRLVNLALELKKVASEAVPRVHLHGNEFSWPSPQQLFRVCGTRNSVYVRSMKLAGYNETVGPDFIASYGLCQDSEGRDIELLPFQRSSRFISLDHISDKGLLARNIKRMQAVAPQFYDFFPMAYELPEQLTEFSAAFSDELADRLWLLKPTNQCCGRGVRLVSSLQHVSNVVDFQKHRYIIQQFVAPPLLVDGHKFALRLFALLSSADPLRVYLHRDGLVFYTVDHYSVANKTDYRRYISDWFFSPASVERPTTTTELFDYLKPLYGSRAVATLWSGIHALVANTLLAAHVRIGRQAHPSLYECLGFDIVVDENLKPWLCEVNEAPNMDLEVNYIPRGPSYQRIEGKDAALKQTVMNDVLQLVGLVPHDHHSVNIFRQELHALLLSHNLLCDSTQSQQISETVCVHERDLGDLASLETELRRMGSFEPSFPCSTCSSYLGHVHDYDGRIGLSVWWIKQRGTLLGVTNSRKH